MAKHLLKIGKTYYYNRRVPQDLSEYDSRKYIRLSLKTDSYDQALKKMSLYDEKVEQYWKGLIETGYRHSPNRFKKVVREARLLGFAFKPVSGILQEPTEELIKRTLAVEQITKDSGIKAVLGGHQVLEVTLSQVPEKFWAISKDRVINKSAKDLQKWKHHRERAIKNFIALIGNKALHQLNKDDIIAFRDWWIDRIQTEGKSPNTANKELGAIRSMITAINDHDRLELQTDWLFKKISLKDQSNEPKRTAYSSDFIKEHILAPNALSGLNEEARAITRVLALTGARPKEICGLKTTDIILNHEIPHIKICFKTGRELKTIYSQRDLPLIGEVLEIFKTYPNGFERYHEKAENLSATINKYLKENGLKPTKLHCLYSLRHSFQDRMIKANVPERVQCELFGHQYSRPKYGDGGGLEVKREWLVKLIEQINVSPEKFLDKKIS